jgi:trehalose 6-phosphate phosphatase
MDRPLQLFDRFALLLDLDGTLLDIAPKPELVAVPQDLPDCLLNLRNRLGNALGIISGRPIEQIDQLLPGVPYAIAGEHGGAIRAAPGWVVERPSLPAVPDDWIAMAERAIAAHAGSMLEHKRHGFVLHYRLAPQAESAFREVLLALLGTDHRFELMPAAMAWEVRPAGIDKGVALKALMSRPPFEGRLPFFIGDDVTDEDAIRVAVAMGGIGLKVDEAFLSPAGVRAWLVRAAEEPGIAFPLVPVSNG